MLGDIRALLQRLNTSVQQPKRLQSAIHGFAQLVRKLKCSRKEFVVEDRMRPAKVSKNISLKI